LARDLLSLLRCDEVNLNLNQAFLIHSMSPTIIPLSSVAADLTPLDVIQMDDFRDLTETSAAGLLRIYDTFCDIVINILGREQAQHAVETSLPIFTTNIIQAA
jgi:hypothetical protein